MHFPPELRTSRLVLRPWRSADAAELLPILEANRMHLGPWIPARVSNPAPVPELEQRLQSFADLFEQDREWRYAMTQAKDGLLLGEIGLFPRDASRRVAFAEADRVELGYWLRADATGTGVVQEAGRTVLDAASQFKQFSHCEIRCDPRNAPSVAVARRLGFELMQTTDEPLQVWSRSLG